MIHLTLAAAALAATAAPAVSGLPPEQPRLVLESQLGAATSSDSPQPAQPEVPYVPTPIEVVDEMLQMAEVKPGDVVYDLGCGDGRIVIRAAKQYGARGVGIDIDPERIREARQAAKEAGVEDRVTFREQDLFQADLHEANVVTLYLLPSVNLKLRPKLLRDLRPGTRIVSHAFDMGDWEPERTASVDGKAVFRWTVPQKTKKALLRIGDREAESAGLEKP
jgi:SAM-dependent methyltransferase